MSPAGTTTSPRRLSIREVAERSQRQLVITAIVGSTLTILIVLVFILFHELGGGTNTGAYVTSSSMIESEEHINHMYHMGHHKEALTHLNHLIQDQPRHRWSKHLTLMEEVLKKSNLKAVGENKQEDDDDALYEQIEKALGVIESLKAAPDNHDNLLKLDHLVTSIVSSSANVVPREKKELRKKCM